MNRIWHLPALLVTAFASCVGLTGIDVFAGPSTGDLVLAILAIFLAFHFIAFVLGMCLTKTSRWRLPLVCAFALAPIAFLYADKLYDTLVRAPERPFARFRDNLLSPIPSSVTNLEFVPASEKGARHLMLRFTISPSDLDVIIDSVGFVPTDPDDFRCPVDEFKDSSYLRLPGPVSFYTLEDNTGGYPEPGWGTGHTLKVSRDRTRVIYRRESAPFYRYRYWENGRGPNDAMSDDSESDMLNNENG